MSGPASDLIRVSALFANRINRDAIEFQPSHIVSLLDPSIDPGRIPTFGRGKVLQRMFDDVETSGEMAPTQAVVAEIVDFLSDWLASYQQGGDKARLLVHCHMGASRSTATALLALAMLHGESAEPAAFAHLLKVTNKPWPNLAIVTLGDAHLARGGRLRDELVRYREKYPRRLNAYRRLNSRRGLV